MTIKIIFVLIFTFIISLIGTLGYSVRIVGIKTGRIAVASAVFNILVLISSTSSTVQSIFLAKTIENNIKAGTAANLLYVFRCILAISTLATITGALLLPTFIKVFSKAVEAFKVYRSIPKLILHGFSKSGVEQFKKSVTVPKKTNFSQLKNLKRMPKKIIVLNIIAISISSMSGLAASYAGCLNPDFRGTSSMMSSILSGISTILIILFIDPYLSMATDDVLRGEYSEYEFNRCIIFIIFGSIAGTLFAQVLLVPAANLIKTAAKLI